MVQAAMRTVMNGWLDNVQVVVIGLSLHHVKGLEEMAQNYLRSMGLDSVDIRLHMKRAMFMHMRHAHMEFVDWQDVKMEGPYKMWPLFVDHDVILKRVGVKLMEEYLKYDEVEEGSIAYQSLIASENRSRRDIMSEICAQSIATRKGAKPWHEVPFDGDEVVIPMEVDNSVVEPMMVPAQAFSPESFRPLKQIQPNMGKALSDIAAGGTTKGCPFGFDKM
jgi:hypothetical protein